MSDLKIDGFFHCLEGADGFTLLPSETYVLTIESLLRLLNDTYFVNKKHYKLHVRSLYGGGQTRSSIETVMINTDRESILILTQELP